MLLSLLRFFKFSNVTSSIRDATSLVLQTCPQAGGDVRELRLKLRGVEVQKHIAYSRDKLQLRLSAWIRPRDFAIDLGPN